MTWRWFIAAFVIAALILTCNVKYSKEWLARQQDQPDQMQAAAELLQSNPTAAGKRNDEK